MQLANVSIENIIEIIEIAIVPFFAMFHLIIILNYLCTVDLQSKVAIHSYSKKTLLAIY